MTRTELINNLIKKNNYKTYLEIGVNDSKQPGYNFPFIECEVVEGCDPNVDTTYRMTSDEFFVESGAFGKTYDIIFIDGDHTEEQCYRDIVNSLKILNEGGTIVVHDCNPPTEITTRIPRVSDAWHGTTYKALIRARLLDGVTVYTVDTDEGCGIITKSIGKGYDCLLDNRKEMLNLITVEQWLQLQ